jgi:hypothetical protein
MMRIGITGHQKLDKEESWAWVISSMRVELGKAKPPVTAITSLAIGADQLFAQLVLEKGGSIHAVLPYADIERSFSPEHIKVYRDLVKQATVEILDIPGTDQDAYLAAGHRVVDLSDLIMALWNGLPAEGKGGTADIVEYALSRHKPLIHINPIMKTVIYL